MNFSNFFVKRPIFAGVLSAIIFIAGAISLKLLPISEYPEVVPPTVVVRALYPGANPQVIAETVASPLEQSINGVEDMLYTSSQSTSDGVVTLFGAEVSAVKTGEAAISARAATAQSKARMPFSFVSSWPACITAGTEDTRNFDRRKSLHIRQSNLSAFFKNPIFNLSFTDPS